jgi:hypothetical protein
MLFSLYGTSFWKSIIAKHAIPAYIFRENKYRYETLEQKEVPACYTGIYQPILSTAYTTNKAYKYDIIIFFYIQYNYELLRHTSGEPLQAKITGSQKSNRKHLPT